MEPPGCEYYFIQVLNVDFFLNLIHYLNKTLLSQNSTVKLNQPIYMKKPLDREDENSGDLINIPVAVFIIGVIPSESSELRVSRIQCGNDGTWNCRQSQLNLTVP